MIFRVWKMCPTTSAAISALLVTQRDIVSERISCLVLFPPKVRSRSIARVINVPSWGGRSVATVVAGISRIKNHCGGSGCLFPAPTQRAAGVRSIFGISVKKSVFVVFAPLRLGNGMRVRMRTVLDIFIQVIVRVGGEGVFGLIVVDLT